VVVERLLEHAKLRDNYDRMIDSERKRFSFQNISSNSLVMGATLAAGQQVASSSRTTVAI
jgi:hypothetical protein